MTVTRPVVDWRQHREWAMMLAHRFRPAGILTSGDYEAIALTAVWRAAKVYDNRAGVQFRTFATHFIIGDIRHAIRDTSGVPGWAYERGTRFSPVQWDDVADDKIRYLQDPAPSVAERIVERDMARAIWQAVDALELNYQHRTVRPQVLRRMYQRGESQSEIARALGRTVQAISASHTGALKRLREPIGALIR